MILVALALCAFAQEEVEVVGKRATAADTPSSVTVILVDEALSSSVDVADALSLAPGTVVNRLGGLGAWSSVSIRGSTGRQVEVFLDGIPLNPEGSAAFDLSELPLQAFERLEVYRGSAPPQLDSAAIGGAVNLVSRTSEMRQASLSAGSLGTVRGSVSSSGAEHLLFVDGFTTDGDFFWFDDQGTLFTPADDARVRRENNDKVQGSALAKLSVGDEQLSGSVMNTFTAARGGVPGFTFAPTERVRYGVTRDLLVASASGLLGSVRASGSGFGMLRQETLDDRWGEIGVGRRQLEGLSHAVGGRMSLDWAAAARIGVLGSVSLREGGFAQRDRLADVVEPAQGRTVGRGTLAGRFWLAGERLEVVPTARIIATDRVEWAPQLGARWEPSDAWVLKGTVGRYVRVPDVLELYGDRGSSRGNPDLQSEVGVSADLALQGRLDGRAGWVQFELGGFSTHSRDRIVFVQNAQGVALPLNLRDARVHGVELASGLSAWDRVESSTNLTWTRSQNLDTDPTYAGNQLPRIPLWSLHQRTALVWRALRIGHRYDFVDGNYWDLTNWFRAAPRHLHGGFVRVMAGPWSVEADVLNLTNRISERVPLDPLRPEGERVEQPVTDFAGYPLPGRTFLLTMRWQR